MPLYAFHCDLCNENKELFLSARELRKGVSCPSCRGTKKMSQVQNGSLSSSKDDQTSCSLRSRKS